MYYLPTNIGAVGSLVVTLHTGYVPFLVDLVLHLMGGRTPTAHLKHHLYVKPSAQRQVS